MIIIKSDPEVDLMRQAGRITAGARTIARQMVAPGVTTRQINREVHKFITKSGASPCWTAPRRPAAWASLCIWMLSPL